MWWADITLVRLSFGWAYLVAMIDWFSRYVLAWELSTTLAGELCAVTLEQALTKATSDIFNVGQGSQFTSPDFLTQLKDHQVLVSLDGRGRALDNIFTERLRRSLKWDKSLA